jgi:ParB family chromosome partitioning protein
MEQERKVLELNVEDVLPNRFQPRISFEEDKINDLANSIKEHGVIQPIVVRPIADKFEIIAGERRYKASVMAGKQTIPAIVVDLNDKDSAEIALIENVQRQDLTPIEEAVSYKKILDMGYISQDELAKKLGKSQAAVANKLRLLNLDEDVQEALLRNQISERHARSLLKLQPKDQVSLLKRIIDERLTVRKTDEEISKILSSNDNKTTTSSETSGGTQLKNKEDLSKLERIDFDIDFDDDKKEVEKMNNDNVDPGFVDVNAIEQNAQDIYQQKPVAPVNEFLKPSDIAPTPEKVIPVDDTPITTGKFFGALNYNEQPVTTKPVSQSIPSTQPDYSFLNKNQNNAEKVETLDEPTTQSQIVQQPQPVSAPNVNAVINNIRNCAEAIRNMGFQVDLDEFDLENMYQVVFKVHKN